MVHVYIANVMHLSDPQGCPALLEGLPEERKKKILRLRRERDRKQSLGAGLLLKQVMKRHGIDDAEITYGIHGKPEIKGIHFNLSHSHDYVVCAVGNKAVGCDIEKIEKIRERVAERFFTKNEVLYLNSFEDELKVQEFYRIWTMKESYLKMTGEGMSLPLERLEFAFDDEVKVYRDKLRCSCFIKEYELLGYKLTVCSEDEEFDEMMELLPCLKY